MWERVRKGGAELEIREWLVGQENHRRYQKGARKWNELNDKEAGGGVSGETSMERERQNSGKESERERGRKYNEGN